MTPTEIAKHVRSVAFTWTSEEELAWLAERARGKQCAEFGTYMGASALAMALGGAEEVECFDLFAVDGTFDVAVRLMEHARRSNGRYPCVFWRGDIGASVAHLVRYRPSIKAAFIFIDNGHDYQSVSRDILAALAYSTPDAFICGHDYADNPRNDVARAVHAVFSESAVKRGPGSIWFIDHSAL